jgi:hypothetical protein
MSTIADSKISVFKELTKKYNALKKMAVANMTQEELASKLPEAEREEFEQVIEEIKLRS